MIFCTKQSLAAIGAIEQHAETIAPFGDAACGSNSQLFEGFDAFVRGARLVGNLFQLRAMVDGECINVIGLWVGRHCIARCGPVDVVERRIMAHGARGSTLRDEVLHFLEGRIFDRAKEPRDGKGAAGIGKGAAGFNRLIPQPAAQKAGHEGIARAEYIINFDRIAGTLDTFLDIIRNRAGKYNATHRAALHHNCTR